MTCWFGFHVVLHHSTLRVFHDFLSLCVCVCACVCACVCTCVCVCLEVGNIVPLTSSFTCVGFAMLLIGLLMLMCVTECLLMRSWKLLNVYICVYECMHVCVGVCIHIYICVFLCVLTCPDLSCHT